MEMVRMRSLAPFLNREYEGRIKVGAEFITPENRAGDLVRAQKAVRLPRWDEPNLPVISALVQVESPAEVVAAGPLSPAPIGAENVPSSSAQDHPRRRRRSQKSADELDF
jgi:hypothetical protein